MYRREAGIAWVTRISFLVLMEFAMMSPVSAQIITFDGPEALSDYEFGRTGRGAESQWTVVKDDTALNGLALEQSNSDATDYRFPIAIYKHAAAANLEVTAHFKAVAGNVDRAGGIVIRFSDPNNYYVLRANALEDNVRFYRMLNGKREELKGVNKKVSSEVWHILRLKAEGPDFTVSFDGEELFSLTDETFAKAGKVGLWTKADSVTRFDRLEIKKLP
jgi:hypothetical protein